MTTTFNAWPESNDGTAPSGERSHVALLGARSDLGASTGGGGQSGAPSAIRAVSVLSGSSYDPVRGGDGMRLTCVDCNDAIPVKRDISAFEFDLNNNVSEIQANTDCVILLGGDDSVNLPALAAFSPNVATPGLPVLHFDAHPDTYPPEEDEYDHANWVSTAIETGCTPSVTQFGVRAFGLSEKHYAKWAKKGVTQVTGDTFHMPEGPVYVAVDIDVVDPAYAPGVSVPTPGGITAHALLSRLHLIAMTCDVRCLSITEVNPMRDRDNQTSLLAASAIHSFLNGMEMRVNASK